MALQAPLAELPPACSHLYQTFTYLCYSSTDVFTFACNNEGGSGRRKLPDRHRPQELPDEAQKGGIQNEVAA